MATKLERFNSWTEETKAIIAKSHDVESGYAHFVDDNTIEVNGHQYQSNRIVIATGQRPHRLAIPGDQFTHTSRDVLSLPHLPQHVTFIGGGYVAMELATVLGAAGAAVTIIDHSARPLKAFPASKVQVVKEAMEKRGVEFLMDTSVQGVRQQDEGFIVQTDQGEIPTDYVVDTSGRQPNIDRLALEAANIDIDRGGIIVNEHLQTSNPNVYAIGDVISRPQPKLTPVAEFEGEYLFNYLEEKTSLAIKYPTIGTAAFTFPEIAEAGVKEEEVRENSQYQTKNLNLKYSSLAAGQNDQTGKLTLIFEGAVLAGVSVVGDHAADDVNNFLPIIGLKVTGEEYRQAIIAIYPALADKVAGGLI